MKRSKLLEDRIDIAPTAAPRPTARILHERPGPAFPRLPVSAGCVRVAPRGGSHIVDPHTGLVLTDHSLITVIAPDCFTANCYTTSASVIGPERGLKLIDETPGIAGLLVRKPGGEDRVY
ncbi:MAG: FAD:protein FMN transferase [Chthoniobacteraceae bacterium]